MARMNKTEKFLFEFLVESGNLIDEDFEYLTEDEKINVLKDIAMTVTSNIISKTEDMEMTFMDRSRGDIKKLKDLDVIQTALTKLEKLVEKGQNKVVIEASKYISEIVKSMMFLNKHSDDFKDGYRNKKVLAISHYRAVVLSIISSITYLISVIAEYNNETNITLKSNIDIEEISPLRFLMNFNRQVEKGDFKVMMSDVKALRESFLEVDMETLTTLTEAVDISGVVVNGIKNIYNKLDSKYRISNILYSSIGIMILIFSIREIYYTLSKTKSKASDMLNSIKMFSNNNTSYLDKVVSFGKGFIQDIEGSSLLARKEIELEDKNISNSINTKSIESLMGPRTQATTVPTSDLFNF